jgi:stringent starvation protein B
MSQKANTTMTPINPYLLRALLGWIEDNQMTPHILVNGMQDGVKVPPNSIKEGKVVLNMATSAIDRMEMSDYHLGFLTRFSGRVFEVSLPMAAILSIYAKETGQGMQLPPMADPVQAEPVNETHEAAEASQANSKQDKRAHLRVVK